MEKDVLSAFYVIPAASSRGHASGRGDPVVLLPGLPRSCVALPRGDKEAPMPGVKPRRERSTVILFSWIATPSCCYCAAD